MQQSSEKHKPTHLPAKAMIYALFLMLLVGIITTSFIMLSGMNRNRLEDNFARARLTRNMDSGLAMLKSIQQPNFISSDIDLFAKQKDSIQIQKNPWGLYDAAVVKASTRSPFKLLEASTSVLMGCKSAKPTDPALYLVDRNRSLSMAGKSLIRGDAFLPAAGIKRANVNGINFLGQALVEGNQKRSTRRLPKLDTSRINYILSLFEFKEGVSNVPKTVRQSFADSTLYLQGQNLLLSDMDWKGNIIVQATEKIQVTANCQLEDVILVAPSIVIEGGFTGTVQLFALDSIYLDEGVNLTYPSSMTLLKTAASKEKPRITIAPEGFVHGNILIHDINKIGDDAMLEIGEGAIVEGLIHVDGLVEHKGTVKGSISVKSFFLKTPSTIYDNYLFNAIINREELSSYYLFPQIYAELESTDFVKKLDASQ